MGDAARKNILLISLDDAVSFWKYKSMFGEVLQTPNLDRICEQSTAFHSAYCQAPICSPSRASFMSGKAPHQSGVTGSDKNYFKKIPAEVMWPYTLKQDGYFCSSGGKVMRGFGPLPGEIHGAIFSDRRRRFHLDKRKRQFKDRIVPDAGERMEFGGFRGGEATTDEDGDRGLYDHQVSESAMMFFNKYRKAAPFYREVGFSGPHGPWTTPRRFKEMYNVPDIKMPLEWKLGFDESSFMELENSPNINIGELRYWKKSLRNYFSALTHTDYHLGRVWDSIKTSRHAAKTVIIIVSDHGFHLGERNRFRKHSLWEQVANVPLIIHDPDHPKAQIVNDPVALIDVGQTVMDYAGLPPIDGCVGRSLRPQLDGIPVPDRPIPTFLGDSAAIRKGNYRYIRYADGTTQFFDLTNDWWQRTDLGSGHPDYGEIRKEHAACCLEYGFDVQAAERALAEQATVQDPTEAQKIGSTG